MFRCLNVFPVEALAAEGSLDEQSAGFAQSANARDRWCQVRRYPSGAHLHRRSRLAGRKAG